MKYKLPTWMVRNSRIVFVPTVLLFAITTSAFQHFAFAATATTDSVSRKYNYTDNPEIQASLAELSSLVDRDLIVWMASLYDSETGGFYYSISAKNNNQFAPDIESTAQALNFIRGKNMTSKMPAAMKQKFIVFFQQRQDPETGYFYDLQFGSDVSASKRDRNLGQATGQLERLGAKPLYPLPTDRVKQNDTNSTASKSPLPPQYESEETFVSYLEDLNWKRPYPTGNSLSAAGKTIRAMGYHKTLLDFLDRTQNPETGLWGKGRTYEEINGAMKLSGFYTGPGSRPYPNAKRMVESVIAVMSNGQSPRQLMWVRNPFDLLSRALLRGPDGYSPEIDQLLRDNLPRLIDLSVENLKKFRQEDGGYSYYPDRSSPTSQGAKVSLGVPEGDINGTTAGLSAITNFIHRLVGAEPPTTPHFEDLFYETVREGE